MKIVLFITYTINGLSAASPLVLDTPFYVRDQATCQHYAEAVSSDYEKTQPGFKVKNAWCVLK